MNNIQASEFTKEQLLEALISVRQEANENKAELVKVKRELKDLKEKYKNFEGNLLDQRSSSRRFTVR